MTLDLAVKSGGLLLVAFIACWAMRRHSPAARHLVWRSAFMALLIMPLAGAWLAWELRVLPQAQAEQVVLHPDPTVPVRSCCEMAPRHPQAQIPEIPLGSLLTYVWLAGAGICLVRIGLELVRLRRLYLRSMPIDGPIRRSPEPGLGTAVAFGFFRPVVLLPLESTAWSEWRYGIVTLHELAHLRRGDYTSNLLAELVCAIYWFNPLVWLGARAMRLEAESATDNVVLESGVRPSDYATELVRIAADLAHVTGRPAPIGASPMVQTRIETRLARILSSDARRRGVAFLPAISLIAIAVVASAGLAGMRLATAGRSQDAKSLSSPDGAKLITAFETRATLIAGNEDAPRKIVGFIDYQCPSCRKSYAAVEDAVGRSKDTALYVAQMPLPNHRLAVPAATLALKAQAVGVYPAVHRKLLEGQDLAAAQIYAVGILFGIDAKPTASTTAQLESVKKSFHGLKLSYVPVFVETEGDSVKAYGWRELIDSLKG
jgi:beta-lactamase regulating signal transducer with metallopeptidase domain